MISSLYIHIPFCRSKCRYCAFTSFAGEENYHGRYLAALKTELEKSAAAYSIAPLQTLFFGGGTPTLLGAESLVEILDLCRKLWGLAPGAEISTEANPETIDQAGFSALYGGGFNRISLGVQSFLDADLRFLGRPHSGARALAAFAEARNAGFANINLDLMYGLHGQSVADWENNLRLALAQQPEHLSLYQLTPEEGTPYFADVQSGRAKLPSDEVSLAMDETIEQLCGEAGLDPYETSNFARPGHQCRHNLNYWHNNEYVACGAGAVSFVEGVRERRIEQTIPYCEALEVGADPVYEREELSLEESFRETVVVGLRLRSGVSAADLVKRYGLNLSDYYGERLRFLLGAGLLEWQGGQLVLTAAGRPLANMVLAELV